MNKKKSKFFLAARFFFAALAGIFLISKVCAQEDQSGVENRFLFVFSTSAEMKIRFKSEQAEVNQLLAGALRGELHTGDTMGVWTLDKDLRAGQFPLMRWNPDGAATIAGEINKFIGKQRYAGTNNFHALQSVLERVVQSSPRLTVLIFCDGETDFSGTPYDNGINQIFHERRAELKKTKLPFVVVLRTQRGEFAGCSINYSPGMVNLPEFPPLPQSQPSPPPEPLKANVSAPAPVPPAAPLVIIGTRVETNWDAYHFAMTNVPAVKPNPQTNPVAVAPTSESPKIEPAATNAETNPPKSSLETNLPSPTNVETVISNVVAVPATNSVAPTNAVVAASENSDSTRKGTLALAAGFLIGAIALTALFIFRSRRSDRGSLITRTMNKK